MLHAHWCAGFQPTVPTGRGSSPKMEYRRRSLNFVATIFFLILLTIAVHPPNTGPFILRSEVLWFSSWVLFLVLLLCKRDMFVGTTADRSKVYPNRSAVFFTKLEIPCPLFTTSLRPFRKRGTSPHFGLHDGFQRLLLLPLCIRKCRLHLCASGHPAGHLQSHYTQHPAILSDPASTDITRLPPAVVCGTHAGKHASCAIIWCPSFPAFARI